MTNGDQLDIGRIGRLFAADEPSELRNYLSVLHKGKVYHRGTTVAASGLVIKLNNGLWVPEQSRTAGQPLDFAHTYITFSDVTDTQFGIDTVVSILKDLPLKPSLVILANTMVAIRNRNHFDQKELDLDRQSLEFFPEPARSRIAARLQQGSTMHPPQLMMIIAKLMIANCPDDIAPGTDISLPHLAMMIADNLGATQRQVDGQESIPLMSALSVELVANQHFNESYRADSQMALFQRRWLEMYGEAPSPYLNEPLEAVFEEATGVALRDQTAVALALFTHTVNGTAIVDINAYFSHLGWDRERLERVLTLLALPVDAYRQAIRGELREHSLDWYFTTFSRYPVIRFDDELIVLDTNLLLRRCLGYAPLFDIKVGLVGNAGKKKFEKAQRAFTDYSERYVGETFESMVGKPTIKRVYTGTDLDRAYRQDKKADFAIDYGDSWVVVEVSTLQIARDSVNGVSVDGLVMDRDAVIHEAVQVAATIECLRENDTALTGFSIPRRSVEFFPLVVLTEGFTHNPVMTSIIRDELKARGILQGPGIAPMEILDVVELDMIEGIAENSGFSLPDILRLKAKSNFHADSLRNFTYADPRFDPARPQRVGEAFLRVFGEVVAFLGGDPDALSRPPEPRHL